MLPSVEGAAALSGDLAGCLEVTSRNYWWQELLCAGPQRDNVIGLRAKIFDSCPCVHPTWFASQSALLLWFFLYVDTDCKAIAKLSSRKLCIYFALYVPAKEICASRRDRVPLGNIDTAQGDRKKTLSLTNMGIC